MKILVIQQKMIGDVLTSSILFEALRKKYPQAELHFLIYAHTRAVVENNPFIDKLLLFDPERDSSFMGLLRYSRKIRREKYSVVIDVYSKINTAFLTAMSGADKRIAYHKTYTSFTYTDTFTPKRKLETPAGFAIENRMLLLQGVSGDFPLEIKPKIYLSSAEKDAAGRKLREAGISPEKPLFMMGILGSSKAKTYPLKYMAEVLDFVASTTEAQFLFNYIPKQEEDAKRLYDLCAPSTRERIYFNVFGKSLREFLAFTSHCDALIGNEGGAVNMAKALDVPTFAIFSPQIKKESWASYNSQDHMAVHLRDYDTSINAGIKTSENSSLVLYNKFSPNLFLPKLEQFLKALSFNVTS